MAAYFSALLTALTPENFIPMVICTVLGAILGAIPGLSGGLGITLILPLTFSLSAEKSFCMLLGMFVGGISGSFIASVLVGIPGSPSSIATCFDGYPMTQNGRASKALSIGIMASFIGTALSIIVATLLSTSIADLALTLGPWEYFSLCFMAVSMVIGLSGNSIYKGLLSAFIGLFLSTIGSDSVTNSLRFTFGISNLYSGISIVSLLLGLFAVEMVAVNYAKGQQSMPDVSDTNLKGFGIGIKDFTEHARTILVSFLLGLWIGFLPGLGGSVSSMIAYGQAKRSSRHPEAYGHGCEDGVWASETANNASIGGAIIPMIALGIPGDANTALLLSAMIIHGLQPGPMFISKNPELAYLILGCILLSAAAIFVIEILTKRWFPYLLKAPYHYLYSVILVLCFVGAFSQGNNMFAIYSVLIFAVLGIILNMLEIPSSPLLLSFILGGSLEQYFRRGVSYAKGDYTSFFTRPVSCVFLVIGIISLLMPLIKAIRKKGKVRAAS